MTCCYLCKADGVPLYRGVQDKLFGTPGAWDFKICPNSACGLVWLDPMPTEQDIGKAYTNYYTHQDHGETWSRTKGARWLKRSIAAAYHAILGLTPIHWEQKRLNWMYLRNAVPGRMLEVGCGDGSRLARFRELGWDVQGQEVDPSSASRARSLWNVPVHLGSLEQAAFPSDSFDAIIMNHVLEHVHDPVRLLQECNRLLKKGGTFVSITPNVGSYGHRRFQSSWRGLEPPRHLFLFSKPTLRQAALRAGFEEPEVWTTAARGVTLADGSIQILRGQPQPTGIWDSLIRGALVAAYHSRMTLAAVVDGSSGEECVLRVAK